MAILRDGLRPRKKRFELFHCRHFTKFRKLLQQKQQIPKRIKTISPCRFDHTEAQRTCICTLRGVTKQEVPSGHNERLHGPLCKIVGKRQTAIQQNTFQGFPLVQWISLCLAKIWIFVRFKAVQKLPIRDWYSSTMQHFTAFTFLWETGSCLALIPGVDGSGRTRTQYMVVYKRYTQYQAQYLV